MKHSELKQIIKEEIHKVLNENKYQVVFYDDYIETPVKQLFKTEEEAENWVNDNKSYSDDYNDVYYFNPEDGEDMYTSFNILPSNQKFT
jgi:hypothetical protein